MYHLLIMVCFNKLFDIQVQYLQVKGVSVKFPLCELVVHQFTSSGNLEWLKTSLSSCFSFVHY